MSTLKRTDFSAEKFVDNLLSEGEKVPCDETLETFTNTQIPAYYDEKLYKRGQAFFHENICGFLFSMLPSMIFLLAIPEALKVAIMVRATSTDVAAYRSYLAMFFHVKTWYDFDLHPGSRTLLSLDYVKRKHNLMSKLSFKKFRNRFKQRDMALTMFGFVGFTLIRGRMFGIHNPKEEDLRGFVHVSRVLGHVLGVEDRFNICRDSVQETREICNILLDKYFAPLLNKPTKSFIDMSNYICDKLSIIDPFVDHHFCMTYVEMVIENQDNYTKLKNIDHKNLSWFLKIKLTIISATMYCLKFKIIRLFARYIILFRLWIIRVFPIRAYIKFGIKNSHVDPLKKIYSKPSSNKNL